MKLDSFANLYFVVSVLVPGFIYNGILYNFVPLRVSQFKEILLLRFLTATAINYAICSPLLYLLVFGLVVADHPLVQALGWFIVIFAAPVVLALVHARIIQRDRFRPLYRLLGLRSINPIPTGWDFVFSTTHPCYVLITLTDGTEIAGYFGTGSVASSDVDRRDIYIERLYRVSEDNVWEAVADSQGMYVVGSQIAYIEFRR